METGLKKGSWSVEEDQKLISYINKYGIWNWSQMPRFAGLSRSGKSCRLRWMNYLKPNVKKGKFSKEEEETILHSHSLLGNKWSMIASRLPGRTDNDVKNHWHSHLKKRANEHNMECETEKNEMNSSPTFEAHNVDELQQSINNMNSISEPQFNFEDYHRSYSCPDTFMDHDVEFSGNFYDTGSPGTLDDLQCFWDQLCPMENLEFGNNHQNHVSTDHHHFFQDSYDHDDPSSSYNFLNNDYNISILPHP